MSRVVVVGSANLDLGVAVPHLPAPGETVLGDDVAARPGGKGSNQAVAARRLGADTLFFAAVGDDRFGADVRAALTAEGLPPDHLTTVAGVATGVALIVVDTAGENSIVVAPGANARLTGDALAALPATLGPDAVLVLQLEIPLATCLAAARHARDAGARVVLNAAPLPDLVPPTMATLLRHVDVLVVNEGEALRLAGVPATDWAALAAGLRTHGPAACVITLGERGAVHADAAGVTAHPAFPVDAVDTTGAGDSFVGALAASLADGQSLAEAVHRGCAAGALATTRMGAQSALPTRADLDRFRATHPEASHA
ncbi:ribokinase [Micromonospora halotolerans]|uniref:Ribokinase n=1 Tax=Micromonospora halotolerans TaxID=709879 RepID=A0ABY9ZUQ7_9ACTN|nr:ribokinase [Micromonospora halotolerans]WNM38888.1 ribokinase [Micromonospora halotolerans]